MIQSRTKNMQGKKCGTLIRKQSIENKGSKLTYFRAKKDKRAKRKR